MSNDKEIKRQESQAGNGQPAEPSTVILYRNGCQDSHAAAYAAWMKIGEAARLMPIGEGESLLDKDGNLWVPMDGCRVFIFGVDVDGKTLKKLISEVEHLTWIDHRESAFKLTKKNAAEGNRYVNVNFSTTILLDRDRSTGLAAWEFFNPAKKIPRLVRYLDLFARDSESAPRQVKALVKALQLKNPAFEDMSALIDEEHEEAACEMLVKEGQTLLMAQDQAVSSVIKASRMIRKIGGIEGWMANAGESIAEAVAQALANESKTFGLCWYINHQGQAVCVLRSADEKLPERFDLAPVLAALKGEGGPHAATVTIGMKALAELMA